MPNVVRFVLESQRNLDVPGAGRFVAGVLDVPATNLDRVALVRFLVGPYGGKEYGTVDSASTAPTLPAVPLPPAPDPLPQYAQDGEVDHLAAEALKTPGTELYLAGRAAFLPRWTASTTYAQGDIVLSPTGAIVQAKAGFTSGSSYDASNWTIVAGGAGGGGLTVASVVTAAGALVGGKHTPVDATAGPLTMTLPTGQAAGTMIAVEKTDTSTNAVTLTGSIRGVASQSIVLVWAREALLLVADASGSWWPVAGHKTKTALDAAYVASSTYRTIVRLTQAAYDALAAKDTATLYVVVG